MAARFEFGKFSGSVTWLLSEVHYAPARQMSMIRGWYRYNQFQNGICHLFSTFGYTWTSKLQQLAWNCSFSTKTCNFLGVNASLNPEKAHPGLQDSASFEPLSVRIRPGVSPVCWSEKNITESIYVTHMHRRAEDGFAPNLVRRVDSPM